MKHWKKLALVCAGAVACALLGELLLYRMVHKEVPVYRIVQADRVEISVGMEDVRQALVQDPLCSVVEQRLGVKLEPQALDGQNQTTALQIAAASQRLPDLLVYHLGGTGIPQVWKEQGVIRSLPQDLSAFPHLEAYLRELDTEPLEMDGRLWCIPCLQREDALGQVMVVRKDWREKLGLEPVTSQEELEAVAEAFVTQDPDGNGAADTGGIEVISWAALGGLYQSDYPALCNLEYGWVEREGVWMPAYASAEMAPALQQVQALWKRGLVRLDTLGQQQHGAYERFLNDQSGILVADWETLAEVWVAQWPDRPIQSYLEIVRPWPSDDGVRYRYTPAPVWGEVYISAQVSDQMMGKILQMLDFLLSEEFQTLAEDTPRAVLPSGSWFLRFAACRGTQGAGRGEDGMEQERAWFEANTQPVDYSWLPYWLPQGQAAELPDIQEIYDRMAQSVLSDDPADQEWQARFGALSQSLDLEKQYPLMGEGLS